MVGDNLSEKKKRTKKDEIIQEEEEDQEGKKEVSLEDIGGDNLTIPEPKIALEIGRLAKEMGSSKTSPEHPEMVLSDISNETEVLAMAGLLTNNRMMYSRYREDFVMNILKLRISMRRQGRREIIATLRSVAQSEQEAERQGVFSRLKNFMGFGGRREYV